jgi:NAD(P) transhydrogenase subunit alpha
MQIGIPMETVAGESRVAATPETVKKLVGAGHSVVIQKGAGRKAAYLDDAYTQVGATIAEDAYQGSQIILKVRAPQGDEIQKISANTTVIAMFDPYRNTELEQFATQQISAFALELLPRTLSRAQNMDVLSSQANLSGYKSVLLAANEYQRMFPMLMTAAGTVKPARVVVMGVGVAGLQAIATAKRLGAVVEATDLRPTAKDQVESLGEMARCANVRRRTAACCRCSEEWLWLDARRTVHQGSGCNC